MTLERWQVWILAGSILCAGLAVAGGAFLGGYALGDQPAPPPPTELAEKTYTAQDLETALAACEIDGVAVEGGAVTLLGSDYPGPNRQCVVREMGPPPLALTEYENFGGEISSGDYSWSNVTMSWEQTGQGRDVTITVAG